MNLFPKKRSPTYDPEAEEKVWEDLPSPPTFDAEDESLQGGDEASTKDSSEGEDGDDEAVRLRIQRLEGAVRRLEMYPVSPVPPDARLSVDDLRMEDFPDQDRRRIYYNRESEHGSPRWVFYVGLSVMVILIGALVFFTMLNNKNPKVNPLGMPPMTIDQEEEYPMGEHIADLLARKDGAIELFGRFLRTESRGELLGMVRQVDDIEALVRNPPRPSELPPGWKIPADARWDVHTEQQPVFGVLSAYYPDDRKFQAFMTLEGGILRLDWKATVCYSTAPFSLLAEGKGNASEVRVWVEPATFYSAAFPETDYRSFKIHTTLEDPPVWAFARRDTLEEQELARFFHKSIFGGDAIKASMMVLSLNRGPAEAMPNQWLITDLLHTAWVLP